MQCWGFIRPEEAIEGHFNEMVKNLAGKKVILLPETSTFVKGHGYRVNVIPTDLSNEKPYPMMLKFIRTDDRTIDYIEGQARKNCGMKS